MRLVKVKDLEGWRVEMGLSKQKAADLLGISRQHYSKIVAGDSPIPHWMALYCAALFHRLKPWTAVL